jgi:hypothetical protein
MFAGWMYQGKLFVAQLATPEELEVEGIREINKKAEDLRLAKLYFLLNKLNVPELQREITVARKEIKGAGPVAISFR